MKAGFYVGDRQYEVRNIPIPTAMTDQVLIEVAWCGLCATDVHKFNGRNGAGIVVPPIILGHECSGVVVDIGPDVKHFKKGDRVAVDPCWSCGKCIYCQAGKVNFCVSRHGVAKGFSDYVCPPESNVYHISDNLSLKHAAFAEPLSCAVHGMDLINVQAGSTVALYGLGAIGSLLLQMSILAGAKQIVVIEKEASKRELALELGATHVVDTDGVVELAKTMNIDFVIEATGLIPLMEQSCNIAGKGAKVLWFGLGDPEQTVKVNPFLAFTKELSIYTSFLNPHSTAKAIQILESHKLELDKIISAELTLEEMEYELKSLENSRRGKVMVKLSGKN